MTTKNQSEIAEKYRQNPNPNAKIGFVIFYPFQFYVFKNVYKHLADEAEFIIDGGRFFPSPPPPGLLTDCEALLMNHGVFFRVLHCQDYKQPAYLADFFSPYKALVSLWMSGCISIAQTKKIRKVHMNYGAGKELTMFGSHCKDWDLYLCLGPRVYDIIRLYTWAETVGYPKFDDWFNNEFDDNFLTEFGKKLNPSKKIILYLPTHGDLSAINDLTDELIKLDETYNVLVKLHYYTSYEEPERMEKLKHSKIMLFSDETDLLPLLKITDVAVSDNSSAIFDAILADKPVVVTDFLSKHYLDVGHKRLRSFRFRFPEGALTYSQSIEQKIKKDGSVIAIKNPSEFQAAIKQALADSQYFKDARKKLREEIFAFSDGKCGKRAAAAIKKLVVLKELPEKPILYHIFNAEAGSFSGNYELAKIRTLPFYKRIAAVLREFF